MTSKVVLAYPYTDDAGKDHKPDTTVTLADDVAEQMVRDGVARRPEDDNDDVRAPKQQSTTVDVKKES